MIVFPPCKINLGLQVISKRPDGYHNIESCFYPVPWTDILEIIPSSVFYFASSGIDIPGDADANLCVKAYRLLQTDFDLPPVSIYLHKLIPAGAGLGGGSSDAAHTLRILNSIFNLNLDTTALSRYASVLGSDCTFFVYDKPMIGTGRGDVLNELSISLRGKRLVVVKPQLHVSTAEAYSGITPREPGMRVKHILEKFPPEEWKNVLRNDFEESVFKKHPSLLQLREKLYEAGAVYASMSGSGSAVFGIFENDAGPVKIPEGDLSWSGIL